MKKTMEIKELTVSEVDVKLTLQIRQLKIDICKQNEIIAKQGKVIINAKNNLDAHINRQYAEIRVIEADGKWGDYSGRFELDDDVAKDEVIKKAEKHFEHYFINSMYHRDKKLGLFVFSPRSGNQLVKRLETK